MSEVDYYILLIHHITLCSFPFLSDFFSVFVRLKSPNICNIFPTQPTIHTHVVDAGDTGVTISLSFREIPLLFGLAFWFGWLLAHWGNMEQLGSVKVHMISARYTLVFLLLSYFYMTSGYVCLVADDGGGKVDN